ncbi:MAG: 2-hydroxy-3-oxopropionate reductase [Ktedonobacteraceae bacterium]
MSESTTHMQQRIGFIGLGIMGKPMVRNLLKAGYTLTVFNRSKKAVEELVSVGVTAADSPHAVAMHSEIVITMLPNGPDVEAVVLGNEGVLQGAHEGLLVIDMSTISPTIAISLHTEAQRHNVYFLDAPVSGGEIGAVEGTLSIMVGGDANTFERARPVLQAMGKTVTYCGASGAGQIVKACNQLVVALIIEAISEALVFGSKAGVQPEIILHVLGGGLAQNRVMDLRGQDMIQHHFEPGGKAKFHRKDLGIVLEMARKHGVALPMTALVDQLFTSLIEHNNGERDHSSLLTILELLSNHSLMQEQQ